MLNPSLYPSFNETPSENGHPPLRCAIMLLVFGRRRMARGLEVQLLGDRLTLNAEKAPLRRSCCACRIQESGSKSILRSIHGHRFL